MIDIAILEDHVVFTEGLSMIFDKSKTAKVSAVYHNIDSCRNGFAENGCPDVLLLDVSLPDGNGIEFLPELKQNYPALKIIMLTMFSEAIIIKRSFQNGADGFLEKTDGKKEIINAVNMINSGEKYISECDAEKLDRFDTQADIWLTKREIEVLEKIAEGLSYKQISKTKMKNGTILAYDTVRTHAKNILQKLDVHNKIEAVKKAQDLGLLI